MTERTLEAGDIVWADFEPVRGSEQGGARPALVISSRELNRSNRRSIVCPITRNAADWPTKHKLAVGSPVDGFVLTDQVRSIDRETRGFRFVGRASDEDLRVVRGMVINLISDPDGPLQRES